MIKTHFIGKEKVVINGGAVLMISRPRDGWPSYLRFHAYVLADQMGISMVFTGNSLGLFTWGKFFYTNMFGRMKTLMVAARDLMYSKI